MNGMNTRMSDVTIMTIIVTINTVAVAVVVIIT